MKSRPRSDVILATKVAGRSDRINWLRKDGSSTVVNREQILESVDASLTRLGVDYIDLLQIHWPDRYIGGLFGQRDFSISESRGKDGTSFEEQLSTLKDVVDSGKVRYIGVSNETPYGVCSMVEMAKHSPELVSSSDLSSLSFMAIVSINHFSQSPLVPPDCFNSKRLLTSR
jgi:aryl-alcohol dehydrogenase-like predicted oxidoreductase